MKKILTTAFLLLNSFCFATGALATDCSSLENENEEDAAFLAKYCVDVDTFAGKEAVQGEDGIGLLTAYIGVFYKAVASVIGVICVLIVVMSAIQITLGGLDPEGVNQAKDRIIQAAFSLILLFSSALILRTVNPGFFT